MRLQRRLKTTFWCLGAGHWSAHIDGIEPWQLFVGPPGKEGELFVAARWPNGRWDSKSIFTGTFFMSIFCRFLLSGVLQLEVADTTCTRIAGLLEILMRRLLVVLDYCCRLTRSFAMLSVTVVCVNALFNALRGRPDDEQ